MLLHIGLFKTGNQSLQSFLRDHEELLAGAASDNFAGARFPHGWLRMNCHLEPHLAFMRLDRSSSARIKGDEWRDSGFRAYLVEQIRADLAAHPDELTVLSGEHNSLLRYDDEIAPLRELLGDAEIVVYLRNRDDWIASLRDELEKYEGLGISLEPDAFNYVEPDSWLLDYDARIATWRKHFSKVTVLDYDDVMHNDGSVIPSFCDRIGVDAPAGFEWYRLNARGTLNEGRTPGTRWTGGSFGQPSLCGAPS